MNLTCEQHQKPFTPVVLKDNFQPGLDKRCCNFLHVKLSFKVAVYSPALPVFPGSTIS